MRLLIEGSGKEYIHILDPRQISMRVYSRTAVENTNMCDYNAAAVACATPFLADECMIDNIDL